MSAQEVRHLPRLTSGSRHPSGPLRTQPSPAPRAASSLWPSVWLSCLGSAVFTRRVIVHRSLLAQGICRGPSQVQRTSTCRAAAQPAVSPREGRAAGRLRVRVPPPPHAGSQRGLVRPWEGRRAVNNEAGWLIHESPRNTEHNGSKLCINKLWLRCMIIKVGAPVFHVIYCENNSCGEGSVVFRISRPSHPRGEAEVARLSADEDRRAGSRSPEGAFHFLGMVSEGLGLGAGPSCAGERPSITGGRRGAGSSYCSVIAGPSPREGVHLRPALPPRPPAG